MRKIHFIFLITILIITSCTLTMETDSKKSGTNNSYIDNITVTLPPENITFNNIYYVSTTGNDSNHGSITSPFLTLAKAFSVVQPGDCIYLRGGVHYYSTMITTTKSGISDSYIALFAYQNEKPILDFSGEERQTFNCGIRIKHNYWYIKGITVRYASYNGIKIESGNYNIIENCVAHDNGDTGIAIGGTGSSYNSIINCDSYRNYDPEEHGEDADGFGAKFSIGENNYFYGCRAWHNSDDGFDFWKAPVRIIVEKCWAFENGKNLWSDTAFQGNGNGIKLGGDYIAGNHIVKNSLAFNNENKGFDQNNNTGALTLYNNSSFNNKKKNFAFWLEPTNGFITLKNNLSYPLNIQNQFTVTNIIFEANSWQLAETVTDTDFKSIDYTLATTDRQSNGSLPEIDFLKLATGSKLIDKGVYVGIPFKGQAPDIGAFEY